MCRECGCGTGDAPGHDHDHHHHHGVMDRDYHGNAHHHESHDEPSAHGPENGTHHDYPDLGAVETNRRRIPVQKAILSKNDGLARKLRSEFRNRGLVVVNMLSSPGSGKTTLLQRTLNDLASRSMRAGVIVGDLATDNDARRLRETGAPIVQVTTGGVCHLEAAMVGRALAELDLLTGPEGLDILFIENVGNLVCPASYDLGEDLRVVLLSVAEGEDKPLKYPVAFRWANAVVISKIDMAEAAAFDRETAIANLHRTAPDARVFELSARTGEGLESWCEYLRVARPTTVDAV